ncbi:MAG: protease SohB [Gammaproteobacteria bacterium]
MLELIFDYSLFLAKAVTVLVVALIILGFIISSLSQPNKTEGHLQILNLGKRYSNLHEEISAQIPSITSSTGEKPAPRRRWWHFKRKEADKTRPVAYILSFDGDLEASDLPSLRQEINSVLLAAQPQDEVLIKLDSPGGTVTGYGLVAAQLSRLTAANIPLTVAVDQVAASGGYLAACVANTIRAAPFALIGSIGVILQMPNFNRLLKKNAIDFEQITAGKHKRDISMFGEVGEPERQHAHERLAEIHQAFIAQVQEHRSEANLEQVRQGDVWLASEAQKLGLIDELGTSDDWLLARRNSHHLLALRWHSPKNWSQKWLPRSLTAISALLSLLPRRLGSK